MLSDESSCCLLQDTQVSCVIAAACSAAAEKEALISLYATKSGALKLQTNAFWDTVKQWGAYCSLEGEFSGHTILRTPLHSKLERETCGNPSRGFALHRLCSISLPDVWTFRCTPLPQIRFAKHLIAAHQQGVLMWFSVDPQSAEYTFETAIRRASTEVVRRATAELLPQLDKALEGHTVAGISPAEQDPSLAAEAALLYAVPQQISELTSGLDLFKESSASSAAAAEVQEPDLGWGLAGPDHRGCVESGAASGCPADVRDSQSELQAVHATVAEPLGLAAEAVVNQPLWTALPAAQQGLAADAAVSSPAGNAILAAQQHVRGTNEEEAHPQHAGKSADARSCSSTSQNETRPSTEPQQGARLSILGLEGSAQEVPAEAMRSASCSAGWGPPSASSRASGWAGVSPEPGHGQMQQSGRPPDANSVASRLSFESAGCLSADSRSTAGLEAIQRDHQVGSEDLKLLMPLSQPPPHDSPAAEIPDTSSDGPQAHTEPQVSPFAGTSRLQEQSPVGAPAILARALQQQAAADKQLQQAAEAEAEEDGAPATPGNVTMSDMGGLPQPAAVDEQPQQAAATGLAAEEEQGPAVPADAQQAGLQTLEASVQELQIPSDAAGQPAAEPSRSAGALQPSEEPSTAEEGHQAVVTVGPATGTGGVSEAAADSGQEASAASANAVSSSQQLVTGALSAQPGDPCGHEAAPAVEPPALPPPPTSPTAQQQPSSSFSESSDEAAPGSALPFPICAAEPEALSDMPSQSPAGQVQQASRAAPAPESPAASRSGQPAGAVTAAADGGERGLQPAEAAGDLQQLDALPGHADEAQAADLPPAQRGQQPSGPPNGWQAGAAHADSAVSQAGEALQEENGLAAVRVPTPAPEKPAKGLNNAADNTEGAGRQCAGLPESQSQLPQDLKQTTPSGEHLAQAGGEDAASRQEGQQQASTSADMPGPGEASGPAAASETTSDAAAATASGGSGSCKLAAQADLAAAGSTQPLSPPEGGGGEGQLDAEASETSHGTAVYPGGAALADNSQAKAASWRNQQEDSRSAEHFGAATQTKPAAEGPVLSLAAAPAISSDSPPAATDSREAASPGSRAPVAAANVSSEQASGTGAPQAGSGLAAGLVTAGPAAADLVKMQLDTSRLQQLCTAAVIKECDRALLGIGRCFQALRTAESAAPLSLEGPGTRAGQAAAHGSLSAAEAVSPRPRAPGATNTGQSASGGPAMDEALPQHSVCAAGPETAPFAAQQAGPGSDAAAADPGAGRQHRAVSITSGQSSDGTGEAHGVLAEPDGPTGTAPAGQPTCEWQAGAGGPGRRGAQHFHSQTAVQSARLQHGAHGHLRQGRGGEWPPCEIWDYQHPMPRRHTTTGDLHGKHPTASHSVSGRHREAVTAPSHRHSVAVSPANLSKPFQSWKLRRASSHRQLPAGFSWEEASDAQQLLQLGSSPHLTPTYSAALKLMQWTAHGSDADSSELQLLAAKTQQLMRQGCGPELTPTYGAALQSTQAKQQLAPAAPAAAPGSPQTAGSPRGTAHITTRLHRAARSVQTGCQDVRRLSQLLPLKYNIESAFAQCEAHVAHFNRSRV